MARNFLRVFNENQETERSVLIPIMVKKIEKKKFFEKWLEKIFFRGYNFNKWATPYTPLYYESLTQKGSKGHFEREPPYPWSKGFEDDSFYCC